MQHKWRLLWSTSAESVTGGRRCQNVSHCLHGLWDVWREAEMSQLKPKASHISVRMRSGPVTRSGAGSAATESCTRRGPSVWSCSMPDSCRSPISCLLTLHVPRNIFSFLNIWHFQTKLIYNDDMTRIVRALLKSVTSDFSPLQKRGVKHVMQERSYFCPLLHWAMNFR